MKRKNFINKKLSKQSGITLVALVVSIIVLLILATVSVQVLTGDNGLLTKAEQAKNTTVEAEGLERIQLAVMASHDDRGINTTSLANNLRQINGLTDTNNQAITEIILPKSVKLNNIKYKIKEDGKVIINNSILPDEYEQVEYIESSGTQYIATDITLSHLNTINIIWMLTYNEERENLFIFGARDSATKNNLEFYKNIDGYINLDYGNYQDNRIQIETIKLNKWYETKITKELLFHNDIQFNISNTNEFVTPPIYIFYANNIFSGFPMKGKIKKFEIENVANFIPCYSTTTVTDVNGKQCSAGTVGLYDTVEGKFYTNQGTGTFGYETLDGTYVAPSPTNN